MTPSTPGGPDDSVRRYVWHPMVVAAPASRPGALSGRSVAVLGGRPQTRDAVAVALRAAGARTVAVESPSPGRSPAAVADAVADQLRRAGPWDILVDLNLDFDLDLDLDLDLDEAGPDEARRSWRSAFAQSVAAVQTVYDDWAGESDARRCGYLAVTWLGGRMGYDGQGIAAPLGGIWAGFAKSLPHELPACRIKVLDVATSDPAEVAGLVAAELSVFDYYEVGWRDGQRTTLACRHEPAPAPRLELGPADVVLLSGGARGIGFKLAVALASAHRCQVVVTGRRELPGAHEPWVTLDDDAFAAFQRERLVAAAGSGPGSGVGAARRENSVLAADREVMANLAAAHRAGLAIEYRRCDVRDPGDVRRLVDGIDERLRVVVHNAGIAAPTRLRNKNIDVVLDVVASKLDGFVNLADAVRGRDLDWFCNVGSAAGRMGGMVGQIDYAAANEVLTRLGFWANAQHRLPVGTLAWTTWDRIGLIANFDAALRYGTALPVDAGIAKWHTELLAAQPGEVMFLGRVGTALVPSQLSGFLKFTDHPDYDRLHSLRHFLGEVEEHRQFHSFSSRVVAQAGHPWAGAVTVGGTPSIPVAIALEYAASVGTWVAPEGWPTRYLTELRDVRVDVDALVLRGGELTLRRRAEGSRVDGRWCVDVSMHRDDDGREVATARLVYSDDPVPPSEVVPQRNGMPPAAGPNRGRRLRGRPYGLAWHGLAIPATEWTAHRDRLRGRVRPTSPADLWAMPNPPHHLLPTNALEGILAAHASASGAPTEVLRIGSLRLATGGREDVVDGSTVAGRWTVLDVSGSAILTVDEMSLR
jgi:NAD(P)-dependent dehydrogenase (short-subunit alcohol dehydrogenase family)